MTWRVRGSSLTSVVSFVLMAACSGPTDAQLPAQSSQSASAPAVHVEVNAAAAHQTMDGFGATAIPLIYQNGNDDKLPPALRMRALQAAYRDVRLTLGNV